LLQGLPTADAMLSTHVFASHRQSAIAQVWVGGQARVWAGQHALNLSARQAFNAARRQLLESTQA
jgi:formimidoylglutamate deiminase